MPSIIGVTLVKINQIYRLDVVNAVWDVLRPVSYQMTGSGVQLVTGMPVASGSFDEVIPIQSQFDWNKLSAFSIDVFDQATQRIKIFSARNCEWENVGGTSDVGTVATRAKIKWKGTV